MRKKKSYVLFIIFLLLPLIHLFDNQLLANTAPIPSENDPVEINPLSTDFGIKINIGDPFANASRSFEFNPNDDVLITGSVKNFVSSGASVTVSLWLVESISPYLPVLHIQNITGAVPKGTSKTLNVLNGGDVKWNVGDTDAGTYRVLAIVYSNDVKQTQAVSGKTIIIRQLRLADFTVEEISAPNEFFIEKEIPLPSVGTSYGLTYHNGYLYMTDYVNNAILKIDPVNGSIVSTIYITGYSGNPYGITTDHKSGFYIAYRFKNEYVRVNFDGSFNFKQTTSNYPMALTMLGSYLGITYDSSNIIYKIMPFTGQIIDSWAVNGNYLYGLTVGYDEIWISDCKMM